jgi:hypothetical protein
MTKGTRLEDSGFTLDDKARFYAKKWRRDPDREWLDFYEHFCAKPSSKGGLKVNWRMTWQTWIRNGPKFDKAKPNSNFEKQPLPAERAFRATTVSDGIEAKRKHLAGQDLDDRDLLALKEWFPEVYRSIGKLPFFGGVR